VKPLGNPARDHRLKKVERIRAPAAVPSMTLRPLLVVSFSSLLFTLPGNTTLRKSAEALPLINDLDASIQERLLNAAPETLGMSRVMFRPSTGEHFRPVLTDKRDFAPENDRERKILTTLESHNVQVGLYLFGQSILRENAAVLSYRALKGPGLITVGTPRPQWYPFAVTERRAEGTAAGDRLPDWNAIYPVAQRALRSFNDGGRGFEMEFQTWTIAARPTIAASSKCVSCHNGMDPRTVKVGEPIGGVLYAYRVRN